MGAFGNYLSRFLEERRSDDRTFNQERFAAQLGITPPMLSRFLSGASTECNRRTLRVMQRGISPDEAVQGELLASYLRDQLGGPGASRVRVLVDGATARVQESPEETLDAFARRLHTDSATLHAVRKLLRWCARSARVRRAVQALSEVAEDER